MPEACEVVFEMWEVIDFSETTICKATLLFRNDTRSGWIDKAMGLYNPWESGPPHPGMSLLAVLAVTSWYRDISLRFPTFLRWYLKLCMARVLWIGRTVWDAWRSSIKRLTVPILEDLVLRLSQSYKFWAVTTTENRPWSWHEQNSNRTKLWVWKLYESTSR